MKVAYLLAPGMVHCAGNVTKTRYRFDPWSEVDERDWPGLRAKVVHVQGCCGTPARQMRLFGSEQEIADGVVGFSR